ncbi:hypothetical protein GCM10025868_15830 [Angustibacter aerolatus]|uniref:Uncharacterized protein n=1 Tax=Angustibacter aerolatus TaxID=1162965 RepID=A0ABQ6JDS1_9ACTN|nr:hypothetical protein GCM10025868_15830 [Angustibacter aerolatus]
MTPGEHGLDDVLLRRIEVEHQVLGRRVAVAGGLGRGPLQRLTGRGVAGQRGDDVVRGEPGAEPLQVVHHRRDHVGERADDQAVLDPQAGQPLAGALDVREHGRGVEALVGDGQRGDGVGVELDAVVVGQVPDQRGVQHGGPGEVDVVVLPALPRGRSTHGRSSTGAADAWASATSQVAVPTASQPAAMPWRSDRLEGSGPDGARPAAGVGERPGLADQAGQPRGPPREEHRQPARVGVGEVERAGRQVAEAQQRVGADGLPAPHRVGDEPVARGLGRLLGGVGHRPKGSRRRCDPAGGPDVVDGVHRAGGKRCTPSSSSMLSGG